ncbi:MAG: hypothetical protein ACO3XN_06885, partial [Chthoniobacterales bacterium]
LMLRGHEGLTTEVVEANTRVSLANASGSEVVRAYVEAPFVNSAAVDNNDLSPTTVQRRNQAQTHQVEVELTGAGTHLVTLGFDDGGGSNPDSDADGLADAWELDNFGNLDRDGSGDADSDGLADRDEYIVGSDPNDASSGFPALGVESVDGTFSVSFPTVAGRTYTVLARSGLTTGDWVEVTNVQEGPGLSGNPVTGDGTEKTVTETGLGATGARFYRLKVDLGGGD